jgi:hypothetical protein
MKLALAHEQAVNKTAPRGEQEAQWCAHAALARLLCDVRSVDENERLPRRLVLHVDASQPRGQHRLKPKGSTSCATQNQYIRQQQMCLPVTPSASKNPTNCHGRTGTLKVFVVVKKGESKIQT